MQDAQELRKPRLQDRGELRRSYREFIQRQCILERPMPILQEPYVLQILQRRGFADGSVARGRTGNRGLLWHPLLLMRLLRRRRGADNSVFEKRDGGIAMASEVFECPECRHICIQWIMPVMDDGGTGKKLWQCDHCWVIYTEGYRRSRKRLALVFSERNRR